MLVTFMGVPPPVQHDIITMMGILTIIILLEAIIGR